MWIYQFVSGHIDSFQFEAIMNQAAVNIVVHDHCGPVCPFPWVGLLSYTVWLSKVNRTFKDGWTKLFQDRRRVWANVHSGQGWLFPDLAERRERPGMYSEPVSAPGNHWGLRQALLNRVTWRGERPFWNGLSGSISVGAIGFFQPFRFVCPSYCSLQDWDLGEASYVPRGHIFRRHSRSQLFKGEWMFFKMCTPPSSFASPILHPDFRH